jgi:hypothetical protein
MNKQRELAIALLDDENGISEKAFNLLQECSGCTCGDIFHATNAADGRFFLPEDHGLVP